MSFMLINTFLSKYYNMNKSNQDAISGNLNYLIIEYLKQTEFLSISDKTTILEKVNDYLFYFFQFSLKTI